MEIFPSLSDFPGRTMKAEINSIISFGYKEYGVDKKAKCVNVWDMPGWKGKINDDKELCQFIHATLKDAECVVTFNGKRFDEKFIQTRLAMHRLPLMQKVRHVDLYQVVKRNFSFYRNNLKTSAKRLTKEFKMSNEGWPLWVKTRKLVKASMAEMSRYCKQDVDVLEPLLKRLMPLIPNMPNQNLYSSFDKEQCPKCGSTRIKRHGWAYTNTTQYQRWLCQDCGSTSRSNAKGTSLRA